MHCERAYLIFFLYHPNLELLVPDSLLTRTKKILHLSAVCIPGRVPGRLCRLMMSWAYRAQKISLTIYLNVVIIYDYFSHFAVCHYVVVAQELNLDPGSYGGNAPSF